MASMPKPKQDNMPPVRSISSQQQANAALGEHVLGALGQPRDLYSVQVRQLWDDHYRVNVLVGTDATTIKVAHSYFLVADQGGAVIASTPRIAKVYERSSEEPAEGAKHAE
jgi:hypothetical protein